MRQREDGVPGAFMWPEETLGPITHTSPSDLVGQIHNPPSHLPLRDIDCSLMYTE